MKKCFLLCYPWFWRSGMRGSDFVNETGREVGQMRGRNRVLALLGAFLVVPLLAKGEPVEDRAEKSSPGIWPERGYRWFYNPQHHPTWLNAEQTRAGVLEAARQWEICGVRMEYQGETALAPGAMDSINVVGWNLDMPPKLRGITLGKAKAGKLLERDIAFRPDRKEFERFPRLLRKVIVHEFGHAIGLTHSLRCDDVMTLAADCPRLDDPASLPISPTANDIKRCKELYSGTQTTHP